MRVDLGRQLPALRSRLNLILELGNRPRAGSGHGLVARGDYATDAERAMQRINRHESHGGGTVWIGNDATVISHVAAIYLRNNERHVRIHAECGRVIYDDGSGRARQGNKVARDLAPRAEESDINFLERILGQLLDRNRLIAKKNFLPCGSGGANWAHARNRKAASFNYAQEFGPDRAGRADNCSMIGFQGGKMYRCPRLMQKGPTKIGISIRKQLLTVRQGRKAVCSYPISTSRFGLGTKKGSKKTPLGRFRIAEKIGDGMPHGTIFKSRVPLGPDDPVPQTEDLITSRILWLEGQDPENANTKERYIYIHGTKHEDRIGTPDSHGCIRMRNTDVIDLFELVDEGTPVIIAE
jgi:L,D-transpeptidase-like protein